MKKAQLEMHFLGTKATLTLALTLVSLVALMLTACNQTPNSEGDVSTLHSAAAAGQTETVRSLIESGANIEAQDEEDWTALQWAASRGHEETVRFLIESGANIEARETTNGSTPLHWAAVEDMKKPYASLLN